MIADDFSVDSNTGEIQYVGDGTTFYTPIELHRHLANLGDDPVNGSPLGILDISREVASSRSTDQIVQLINGFTIDPISIRQMFGGSIEQEDGQTLYSGLDVLGSVNNPDTELQIVQNGTPLENYWGTGLNASGQFINRIMIQSRANGVEIDGGRVEVRASHLGDTYARFESTLAEASVVAAIQTNVDLNNTTEESVIASWASDFSNVEGLNLIDVDNDGTPESYYSQYVLNNGRSLNDFYEFAKWQTRSDSSNTETLYGLPANQFLGITHTVNSADVAGVVAPEELTFSNGATAQVLAVDDVLGVQIQLLTGEAPTAGDTFASVAGGTGTADSVVQRTLSPVYVGQSTGSNLIGSFGLGVNVSNLSNSDQIFSLTGDPVMVPNNVVFVVQGLAVGDSVIVGPANVDGVLELNQFTAVDASAGDGTLTIAEAIPQDTPVSGTVRVFDGVNYLRVEYSSYSGSEFVLVEGLTADIADGNDVYVSYIDVVADSTTESFTSVFSGTPRSLSINVRNGGESPIIPFSTTGTLSGSGGSSSVIRTNDF